MSFLDQTGQTNNQLSITGQQAALKKLKPIEQYQSISQAPLFNENRKLQQQKPVVRVKKTQPRIQPLKVKPLGIALTTDGILAVIKDLSNGQLMRMKINDVVQGWTLKAVSNESFTFIKGETEKIISYKNDRR